MVAPEPGPDVAALRPAAQLLVLEAEALPALLSRMAPEDFDLPTACAGWSLRDVLAHCGAMLHRFVAGVGGQYTHQENQQDVDLRSKWTVDRVIQEVWRNCARSPVIIDRYRGAADAYGLDVWVHGGDVRDALGRPDAYASSGVDLAVPLLGARSLMRASPALEVLVDGMALPFGTGELVGRLVADAATFVRLVAGRRADPARFELQGKATPGELALFS